MKKSNYYSFKKDRNKGFTLVEMLVAISVLSISIVATFTAVQNGIQSSTVAKDQTTGFYLAQEGMEYIKNIRDENALKSISGFSNTWLTGLANSGDPCEFGKTCIIDSPLKTATSCTGGFGTCPILLRDSVTGLFGYTSGWMATNFKREIQFQSVSSNEVSVIISISWDSRGINKSFRITETLFNRQ